ncbi:uncharacterized [Tachysurus ichikawai]
MLDIAAVQAHNCSDLISVITWFLCILSNLSSTLNCICGLYTSSFLYCNTYNDGLLITMSSSLLSDLFNHTTLPHPASSSPCPAALTLPCLAAPMLPCPATLTLPCPAAPSEA